MAAESPKKTILGYVSAYLKQTPRTYAEAERDHQGQNAGAETSPSAVSLDSRSNPSKPRSAANEK
jgi:hypothetical protein